MPQISGLAVGRNVQYAVEGTAGKKRAYRLAFIAEIIDPEAGLVDLTVALTGDRLGEWGPARGVRYDEELSIGTWSWPHRVA